MNLFHRNNKSPIASPEHFRELYEQDRLPVYRYIYGLTGGPREDVEDLTAETFLRAWKARTRFDGDLPSALSWLFQIAKRLVIDDYRRRAMQSSHDLQTNLLADLKPEQSYQTEEELQILFDLLTEIPNGQREILVLRYFLGWRVGDIAQYTGMTENNVSVIIHRVLTRLREKWEAIELAEIQNIFLSEEKNS